MDIIDDFKDDILECVNEGLIDSVTADWEAYNMRVAELMEHPEKMKAQGVTQDFIDGYYTRTNTGIVLITHPDMETVWRRINKRIYKEHCTYYGFFFKFTNYISDILTALTGGGYWQKLPPSQRNSEYEELVFSLKKIANTLSKIDYHEPALGLMDDRKYPELQFKLFDEWSDFTRKDSVFFYKIPDLLSRYADLLHTEQRHKNVLIDRPNGNDACVSYFARSLYGSHKRTFDSPLYDIISVIAGIFYPDHDTSYNKIRSSIRAMD